MTRAPIAVPALALAALLAASAASAAPPARAAAKPAGAAASTPRPAPVLPFIHDDWDRALHEARRLGIPIFIEAWAPW